MTYDERRLAERRAEIREHRNAREKELALGLWRRIAERIRAGDAFSLWAEKLRWCRSNRLKWRNECWLCTVFEECSVCPLGNCSYGSDYGIVVSQCVEKGDKDRDRALEVCGRIIGCIEGVEVGKEAE